MHVVTGGDRYTGPRQYIYWNFGIEIAVGSIECCGVVGICVVVGEKHPDIGIKVFFIVLVVVSTGAAAFAFQVILPVLFASASANP